MEVFIPASFIALHNASLKSAIPPLKGKAGPTMMQDDDIGSEAMDCPDESAVGTVRNLVMIFIRRSA